MTDESIGREDEAMRLVSAFYIEAVDAPALADATQYRLAVEGRPNVIITLATMITEILANVMVAMAAPGSDVVDLLSTGDEETNSE